MAALPQPLVHTCNFMEPLINTEAQPGKTGKGRGRVDTLDVAEQERQRRRSGSPVWSQAHPQQRLPLP